MADVKGIGWAIKQLLAGERVRRSSWFANVFLVYVPETSWYVYDLPSIQESKNAPHVKGQFSWIGIVTAKNCLIPWQCAQDSLLAIDWEIHS